MRLPICRLQSKEPRLTKIVVRDKRQGSQPVTSGWMIVSISYMATTISRFIFSLTCTTMRWPQDTTTGTCAVTRGRHTVTSAGRPCPGSRRTASPVKVRYFIYLIHFKSRYSKVFTNKFTTISVTTGDIVLGRKNRSPLNGLGIFVPKFTFFDIF